MVRHGIRADFIDKGWAAANPGCRCDPPLSAEGYQQARETGRFLAERVSASVEVFASPFLRTLQTASLIASELNSALSLTLSVKPEHGLGEWFTVHNLKGDPPSSPLFLPRGHGELREEDSGCLLVDRGYQEVVTAEETRPLESLSHLHARAFKCLTGLSARFQHVDNLVLVTHAATFLATLRAALVAHCLPADLAAGCEADLSHRCPTCGVTVIELVSSSDSAAASVSSALSPDDDGASHGQQWRLVMDSSSSHLSSGEQHHWDFSMIKKV